MVELNKLETECYGDKDTVAEETQKLYQKVGRHSDHVSPADVADRRCG